ncbi:MAG: tRNA lysidine(34) synthetase TilS [Kyrpidia sp.]|nr:tRNA lysidine(34) synthetase TilS [Kyrpidia sp.]
MIDRLHEWMEGHPELHPLKRVVAAVSGGVDSMVLMEALAKVSHTFGFAVTVCHVDHRMRPESAEEQQFVEREASRLGLDFMGVSVDVPARVRRTGESPQAAARFLRYRALAGCAKRCGARAVVLAHHGDDQAETVLLRLIRGASPGGLGGMAEVRRADGVWWLRPFLGVDKAALEAYAAAERIPYREDPSNRWPKYLRNRIRLELIPLLEAKYQPRIKEHLRRLAAMARDDEQFLGTLAREARGRCVQADSSGFRVDLPAFSALPAALQRRILTLILDYPSERSPGWGATHIEALRQLAIDGRSGRELRLAGGWRARRTYGELIITWKAECDSRVDVDGQETPLVVPGRTSCPTLGVIIDAAVVPRGEGEARERVEEAKDSGVRPSTPAVVYFDWEKMEGRPLFIRSRRPGDRFSPFGLGGSKKVKEVWIDDKVPRRLRDRWPLVAAGKEIVWMVGWRRSAHWPVTEDTDRVLRLEATWTDEEIRTWLDRGSHKGR